VELLRLNFGVLVLACHAKRRCFSSLPRILGSRPALPVAGALESLFARYWDWHPFVMMCRLIIAAEKTRGK